MGDWAAAERVAESAGHQAPPAPRALLGSLRLIVAAGRGDPAAGALVDRSRGTWPDDGWNAILAGGAAIDIYGDAQRLDRAEQTYDDVVALVSTLWAVPWFFAQVRLAGVLLGQMGKNIAAVPHADRPALVERARKVSTDALQTIEAREVSSRPMGPEGVAWHRRLAAELLRLRWLAGIDPPDENELRAAWERSVEAFEVLGHPFEVARSRTRLAAVLRAQGDTAAASAQAALARAIAEELGALPLLAELAMVDPGGTTDGSGSPTQGGSPVDDGAPGLTPREQEVLALVAQGRTNGQIGKQLFISTKTVSVHVSKILAKFGASGRTEAAAIARQRGLLG